MLKLTAFVLVAVTATTFLGVTMAGTRLGPDSHYLARFTDVTGLNEGDDVRIAGVPAGQVRSIRIVDRRLAEVEFALHDRRLLPASVTGTVKYRNLIGQRYLALDRGSGPPGEMLPEGSTIPVERTRPALNLTVLFNGFKPLFQALSPKDVNELSQAIIEVLQGEGGTVEGLLGRIASLTSTIAERDRVIGEVVANLNTVLGAVNSRGEQLSGVLAQTQQLVTGLAGDRRPIGEAMAGIAELTGATAGLLAEGRGPLRDDIAGLGVLSRNLGDHEELVRRFAENLPDKLNTVMRPATYGSWFNFYLCRASGRAGIADAGVELPILPLPATDTPERCR
ncbi:MlaD family protein [Saccharopolyspora taberi]|uniref:MlaD family protein n=1 Tax=Saccharopolyspora taberi TaxID=60895 RepID=A0ABN3V285_9PSEU